jgi:hypothetical protein
MISAISSTFRGFLLHIDLLLQQIAFSHPALDVSDIATNADSDSRASNTIHLHFRTTSPTVMPKVVMSALLSVAHMLFNTPITIERVDGNINSTSVALVHLEVTILDDFLQGNHFILLDLSDFDSVIDEWRFEMVFIFSLVC